MNKTNDVQKVRERESVEREEGELEAEMGQYVFLLHFHSGKASLRSLFPEHGRICACARACPRVHRRACVRVCSQVHV